MDTKKQTPSPRIDDSEDELPAIPGHGLASGALRFARWWKTAPRAHRLVAIGGFLITGTASLLKVLGGEWLANRLADQIATGTLTGGVVLLVWGVVLYLRYPPLGHATSPGRTLGAAPLGPADGRLFETLGRQEELTQLRGWIEGHEIGLILVTGASGSGRTSLLHSGLPRALGQTGFRVLYWRAVSHNAEESLLRTFQQQWGDLASPPSNLEDLVRAKPLPFVFVLDDLDNLSPREAPRIYGLLRRAVGKHPFAATWIAVFTEGRDEPQHQLESQLPPDSHDYVQPLRIRPLDQSVAATCALRLTAGSDVRLLPRTAAALAADLGQGRGEVLPLDLNVCLAMLDRVARERRLSEVSPESYRDLGGAEALLSLYIDDLLTQRSPAHRDAVLDALLLLVDEHHRPLREGLSRSEVLAKVPKESRGAVRDAFANLASRRIGFLAEEGSGTNPRYSLVHERLVTLLERMAHPADQKGTVAALLAARYRHWDAFGRQRRDLLHRADLKAIRAVQGQLGLEKHPEQHAFLKQSARSQKRALAAWGTVGVLAIAVATIGYRWYEGATNRARFRNWNVPEDLADHVGTLEELTLPDRVNEIDWLTPGLSTIRLNSTSLRGGLDGLPAGVRRLEICWARFSQPLTLPDGLISLDARGVRPEALPRLPAELQQLALGGVSWTVLPELPGKLETLVLTDTSLRDLTGIQRAGSLTALTLSGGKFKTLDGLPLRLVDLTLDGTQVESLSGLPGTVRTLRLRNNFKLPAVLAWPDRLKVLEVDGGNAEPERAIDLASLPRSLTELTLRRLRIDAPRDLPPNLQTLSLIDVRSPELPNLPPSLRALEVSTTRDMSAVLSGLEASSLRRLALKLPEQAVDLSRLPATLEDLTLLLAPRADLGLPPHVRRLRRIDLGLFPGIAPEAVPRQVTDLIWNAEETATAAGLPPGLVKLVLRGGGSLAHLKDLPRSLRSLTVRGAVLNDLSDLPRDLRELNLQGTEVKSLQGVPPHLEMLQVDGIAGLAGLPATVRKLHLAATDVCGGESNQL